MVTHDQEEALTLADKVVCMQHGRIAQIGPPEELYSRPANLFVADFMGVSNLIDQANIRQWAAHLLGGRTVPADRMACVRPEHILIEPGGTGARVKEVQFLGNLSRVHLEWPAGSLVAQEAGHSALMPGTEVGIRIAPEHCSWVSPRERCGHSGATRDRPRSGVRRVCLAVPLTALLVFFAYPLATVILRSVTQSDGGFGFGNYLRIFNTPSFWRATINSLVMSVSTTLLALVFGLVVACAIHRCRVPGRALLLAPFRCHCWRPRSCRDWD